MSEHCAASDNEKVNIVKMAGVAERLINETLLRISYPFRFMSRVSNDKKSGVIKFNR